MSSHQGLRRGVPRAALICCGLWVGWLAAIAAGSAAEAQTQGEIELAPTAEELVRVEWSDGSVAGAGRYGGEHDTCALGSRAYLRVRKPDGSDLWHRYHQAPASPLCNRRVGEFLLDEFTSLDVAFVTASSLYDLVVDPVTGDLYAVGEVRLAWNEGAGVVVARGAIVGHWSADGTLLRDAYLGPTPGGPPSPPTSCFVLCSLPEDGDDTPPREYGGRALTLDGSDVVITGWTRNVPWEDRDVFVARMSGDPLLTSWTLVAGTDGEDEGRDVVVDDLGDSFVTGFAGLDRDVALARVSSSGSLIDWSMFTGPQDDEGHHIALDSQGNLQVAGLFSDGVTFGQDVLTTVDDASKGWSGVFTKDLQPIVADVVEVDDLPGAKPLTVRKSHASPPPPDTLDAEHTLVPAAYEVVTGTSGQGGLRELSSSDDRYLRIVAEETQVQLKVWLDPDIQSTMPLFLREVRAEVRSEFCYTATVSVNGISGPDFLVAGQRDMCPSDEPILTVPITEEFSALLGFDGQVPVIPGQRIAILLTLQFHSSAPVLPGGALPQTAEQDSSVDQISADVEY